VPAIALETSGRIGSIALVDADQILTEETFQHGLQNAAKILPSIDRLIRAQNWSPRDIEQLYLSVGPGSFTGLRLGVTLAKTMALATGVKIVAVPTVRVLAENAPEDAANVIIVLDAKRDQIFTARFARKDRAWIEQEPAHVDSLAAMVSRSPRPVHLLGEGIPFHRKFVPGDPQIIVTAEELWRARASVVASLGMEMARRGEFADPMTLTPIYIRLPEAVEKANQLPPSPTGRGRG
jgi:tRNA threonylcarbamoyladenosine biosynthesis protein TsaB